jgi:hypothetical protein
VTHYASEQASQVAGIGGTKMESTCYYMVTVVDREDKLQMIKAAGDVHRMYGRGYAAPDSEVRFLSLKE